MQDKASHAPVPPIAAGMRGRCPRCGEGRLFEGFLATAPRCNRCNLDFAFIDSGDGPAVFVIFIVGFIVVGLALFVEVAWTPPLWLHVLLWLPLTLALCIGALRPLKGLMIALQYKHKAAEGRIERTSSGDAGPA